MPGDPLLHPINSSGEEVTAAASVWSGFRGSASVVGRRRLTDITNVSRRETIQKPSIWKGNPNPNVADDENDCFKLLQENTTLLRILGEKNLIIDQKNAENQKFRMWVENLQGQNQQLARANSQMRRELNIAKEEVKRLQHDLDCTAAAYKTKKLEMGKKEKICRKPSNVGNEVEKKQLQNCNSGMAEDEPHSPCEIKIQKRKRGSDNNRGAPHNSAGKDLPNVVSSPVVCQVVDETEENDDNKQRCRRLRSGTAKSQVSKMEVQRQPQPKILPSKHQAVHMETSFSSNLENAKDQKAGTVSHSGSEENRSERCTRRARGNCKSQIEKPLEHREEIQPAHHKLASPSSTSISIDEIGEQKQGAEAAFSGKDKVPSNCRSTDQLLDSTAMVKEASISAEKEKQPQNQQVQKCPSTGRPSRRATMGKSYKEVPLNVKMRRP